MEQILEWRIVTGRGKHQNSGAAFVKESILELLQECGIPGTSQVDLRLAGMISVPKASLEDFLERSSSIAPDETPIISPWVRAMYGLKQLDEEPSQKLASVLNAAQFYQQHDVSEKFYNTRKGRDGAFQDDGSSGRGRERDAKGRFNTVRNHENGKRVAIGRQSNSEPVKRTRFDGSNPEDVIPLKRRIREFFHEQKLARKAEEEALEVTPCPWMHAMTAQEE